MRGFRLRMALLSLGVVLGYGSALMHGLHGYRHCHGYHGHGGRDFGWDDDYDHHDARPPVGNPGK